ncbi:MAG: thiosulfate sulfurtransferase GlpE [Parvibaculum sp.]
MQERKSYRRIDAMEAQALLAQGDVLLLDVRDKASFQQGAIEGARHVSIDNLSAMIQSLPKKLPILIYCFHGYASQEYAQTFSDFGFQNVSSLDGGFEAWKRRPLPAMEIEKGKPFRVE